MQTKHEQENSGNGVNEGTGLGIAGEGLHLDGIPEELKLRKTWVCWRWQKRKGKWTKPPYDVKTGELASPTDPSTWATLPEAIAKIGKYDGIGIALEDGLCGVDLDKCVDPKTAQIEPWAREVVADLNSYTEITPSGTGLHVLVFARLPEEGRRKRNVEVYGPGSPRYFTMTGNHLPGTPTTIEHRQEQLDAFHRRYVAAAPQPATAAGAVSPRPVDLADDELIEKALKARNGWKFQRLWEGGYPDDASAGDLALCCHLAFWTGGDTERMDRLFRRSGRMREKWEREDYRARTLAKAVEKTTSFYTPPTSRMVPKPSSSSSSGPWTTTPPQAEPEPLEGQESSDRQAAAQAAAWHLTDVGNGQRFVAQHGRDLRYCAELKTWFIWDGQRWVPDRTKRVQELAKATARNILVEASLVEDLEERGRIARHGLASEQATRIRAMVECAQSDPAIAVVPDMLDRDPWLLNVENGTIDLRTGALHEHRREDLLTRLCPVHYDPTARSPEWEGFLHTVTGGDPEVKRFLQQFAGYCLAGSTREEKLFFIYGPTRSGKSTFVRALQSVLGPDYAHTCDFGTLLKRKASGGPRDDVAAMRGKRLAVSMEVDNGAELAEAMVKQLTGGDTVRARLLYANSSEFTPECKLVIVANDRPRVRHDDDAIWERIVEVPFPHTVPKADRDLKLKETLSTDPQCKAAVLAWAVEGCLDWQQNMLVIPAAVKAATEAYRQSQDPLGGFIEQRCILAPDAWVSSSHLVAACHDWFHEEGIRPGPSTKAMAERLRAMGCESHRGRQGPGQPQERRWLGIALRDD